MTRTCCLYIGTAIVALMIANGRLCAGQLPPGVRIVAQVLPTTVQPGTVGELVITVTLPAGWITYDLEQVPDSVLPTQITLQPATAFAPLESFRSPPADERIEAEFGGRIVRYFRTSPTYRRPILFGETASGPQRVTGWIDFQVRNETAGRCYVIHHHPFQAAVTVARGSQAKPSLNADAADAKKDGGATPRLLARVPSTNPDPAAEQSRRPADAGKAPAPAAEATALVAAPRRLPALPTLRVWADFDRRSARAGEEVVLFLWTEVPDETGLIPLGPAPAATAIHFSDLQGLEALGSIEETAERGAARTGSQAAPRRLVGQVVWRQRFRVGLAWDRPQARAVGRVELALAGGAAPRVEPQSFEAVVATLPMESQASVLPTTPPSAPLAAASAQEPVILLSPEDDGVAPDGDTAPGRRGYCRQHAPMLGIVVVSLGAGFMTGALTCTLLRRRRGPSVGCLLGMSGVGCAGLLALPWLPDSLQSWALAGWTTLLALANLIRQFDGAEEATEAAEGPIEMATAPPAEALVAASQRLLGAGSASVAMGFALKGMEGAWLALGLVAGGALAGWVTARLRGKEATHHGGLAPSMLEPPVSALLIGLGLLASSIAVLADQLNSDGTGWLDLRLDFAGWAALAAIAGVRYFVPWPEAARSVFQRWQRLLPALSFSLIAVACLTVAIGPAKIGRSSVDPRQKVNPFTLRKPSPVNLLDAAR